MSGSVAEDSRDVLEKIKAEGNFDAMRVQVTEAVKKTSTLTSQVQQLVANSDVFKSGKAESMSRKELFDIIRKNHEREILDIAAFATWEVLLKESYGISQQIEQSTHQALCSVYEAREQQRIALHQQQQQRQQLEMQQYNASYGLHPRQAQSYQQ